jgi:hypothetical protein
MRQPGDSYRTRKLPLLVIIPFFLDITSIMMVLIRKCDETVCGVVCKGSGFACEE